MKYSKKNELINNWNKKKQISKSNGNEVKKKINDSFAESIFYLKM